MNDANYSESSQTYPLRENTCTLGKFEFDTVKSVLTSIACLPSYLFGFTFRVSNFSICKWTCIYLRYSFQMDHAYLRDKISIGIIIVG